jgi:hypothetical protein
MLAACEGTLIQHREKNAQSAMIRRIIFISPHTRIACRKIHVPRPLTYWHNNLFTAEETLAKVKKKGENLRRLFRSASAGPGERGKKMER